MISLQQVPIEEFRDQLVDYMLDYDYRVKSIVPLVRTLNKISESGQLPVKKSQSVELTGREVINDHGHRGGLKGLYSATGIKFTTARKVAGKTLECILGRNASPSAPAQVAARAPLSSLSRQLTDGALVEQMPQEAAMALVRAAATDEAVTSADDFCLRRTNWMFTARDFGRLRRLVAAALVTEAA